MNQQQLTTDSGKEKDLAAPKRERAVFASGCFWGTQHMLDKNEGVVSTRVGYTGGHLDDPTYQQVCNGDTGHVEAVEVLYDPEIVDYETLARIFFETHDPTQEGGQGPDVGDQYRSVIFFTNEEQRRTALSLIEALREKGLDVVTEVRPAERFWPAEEYHQHYYDKTGKQPYCHAYRKLF